MLRFAVPALNHDEPQARSEDHHIPAVELDPHQARPLDKDVAMAGLAARRNLPEPGAQRAETVHLRFDPLEIGAILCA